MEEKRNTEVADKDLPEAEYGSFRGRARAQSVDSAFSMLQGCTGKEDTFLILQVPATAKGFRIGPSFVYGFGSL